jgi:hypothetical protein
MKGYWKIFSVLVCTSTVSGCVTAPGDNSRRISFASGPLTASDVKVRQQSGERTDGGLLAHETAKFDGPPWTFAYVSFAKAAFQYRYDQLDFDSLEAWFRRSIDDVKFTDHATQQTTINGYIALYRVFELTDGSAGCVVFRLDRRRERAHGYVCLPEKGMADPVAVLSTLRIEGALG